MKYIDRKSLGVELFLASRSVIFTRNNELSADELMERLRFEPLHTRARVVNDVRNALLVLKSDKYDVADILPEEVAALSNREVNIEHVGGMKPFFTWLNTLWRDNDHARSNWLNSLKSAAGAIGGAAGDCILALGTGHNQRMLVRMLENGDVEMSLHERTWGRLKLTFPNAKITKKPEMPLLGFLYLLEAQEQNGECSFAITFDTEFAASAGETRPLEKTGWSELEFTCGTPRVSLEPTDYVRSLRLRGVSRFSAVRLAAAVLCEKSEIAGEGLLTMSERAILPLARFLTETKIISDGGKKGNFRAETRLADLLDNRYAVERIVSMLDDGSIKSVSKTLSGVLDALEEENIEAALDRAVDFSDILDEKVRAGEAGKLIERLYDAFEKASAEDGSDDGREASFRAACAAFDEAVRGELEKMGFTGIFPEYRRVKGRKIDLLTVQRTGDADFSIPFFAQSDSSVISEQSGEDAAASTDGRIGYRFFVCQAKVRRSGREKKAGTFRGLPEENIGASDLCEEYPQVSRHGSLACVTPGGGVIVCVSILDNTCRVDGTGLKALTDTVRQTLKNRSLSRSMRKNRKKQNRGRKKHSPMLNAFIRFLPASNIMCAVTGAAYAAAYYMGYAENIPLRTAAIPIALSGIVTAFVASLLYCIIRKNKVWEY